MKNTFTLFSVILTFLSTTLIAQQSWSYKASGTEYILSDLSIPTGQSTIAYAAGSEFTSDSAPGVVIKSTDAGETWNTVYAGNSNIQKIKFVSATKGFVSGYNNTFKKTEDGGTTWTDVSLGIGIFVCKSLDFWDANNGFISILSESDGQKIYRTTDGGTTWTTATTLPTRTLEKITYADATTLYGVGSSSSVFKSIDGGNNWSLVTQTPGEAYNVSVNFKDANTGIYAGEEGNLYTTTNAGQTWTESLYTGYHHFYGLLYKGNQILAAGTDEDIYQSNDNGATWTEAFIGTGESQLYDIELFADNSGLVCGSQGKMLKFTNVVLQANDISNKQNVSYYPNPVIDILNLTADKNINSVSVYGVDGILLLTKAYQNNDIKLDLSKLKTGIYIVKANMNGGSQKNMKVIKK